MQWFFRFERLIDERGEKKEFYSWRWRTNAETQQLPAFLSLLCSRLPEFSRAVHVHTRGRRQGCARHGERQPENNNQGETFDQLLCQFLIHNHLLKQAFLLSAINTASEVCTYSRTCVCVSGAARTVDTCSQVRAALLQDRNVTQAYTFWLK